MAKKDETGKKPNGAPKKPDPKKPARRRNLGNICVFEIDDSGSEEKDWRGPWYRVEKADFVDAAAAEKYIAANCEDGIFQVGRLLEDKKFNVTVETKPVRTLTPA